MCYSAIVFRGDEFCTEFSKFGELCSLIPTFDETKGVEFICHCQWKTVGSHRLS